MRLILDVEMDLDRILLGNFIIAERVNVTHKGTGKELLNAVNMTGPQTEIRLGKMKFEPSGEHELTVKLEFLAVKP